MCGRSRGVPAAVTGASLVADQYGAGAEGVPFGQRIGGWVIHFPAVVCTSSPSMITRLCSTAVRVCALRERGLSVVNSLPPADRVCQSVVILPIGSDLGCVGVLFAVMGESETVVRGTNVRCSTCRHIQWVPVDKTAFACERCDAQLTRR
jgi:hypothetical protein